jgi:hypothetical protein
VNGHTTGLPDLSYVAFNSAGIAADGPDRMIGTFWVQASATGTYTLSLDHAATSILSSDITEYTKNYSDAQLVVPEPATSALLVLGFGVFLKRRRS